MSKRSVSPKNYTKLLALSLGISIVSVSANALAASATWDGAADSTWSNLGNWGTAASVPGSGETATFNASSANSTIDLGAGVTVGTVLFDTASAGAYTIGSGGASNQTLTLSTLAGGIQMNSTVQQDELINANLALGTTGTYTIGLTNNSTTNTLTVAGGISASTTGAKVLTVTGAGNTTVAGNLTNGTGTLALTKTGVGTLALSGNNSLSGNLLFGAGRMNVTGGTSNFGAPGVGAFSSIGNTANTTAVVNVASGATFGLTGTNGGNIASGATASGVFYNAGTFNQTSNKLNDAGVYVGNAASSYGYLYNTGTTAITGRMYVGRVDTATQAGSLGLLDVAGGTVTVAGVNQTVLNGSQGSFLLNTNSGNSGSSRPSTSYAGVNVHGGTLSLGQAQTFQTNVGANLYTSINVTGASSKIATTGAAGFNLNYTSNAANTTTLALHNGGTLETSLIDNTGSLSAGVLSFDGGVLKATAADATALIRSGVTTYLQSGGATIDTNGFNTAIASTLQAPSGNGVTSITLGGTLTGYVGAPLVKISGGNGTGAAAVATFDPATGTVTGITITSPGSGYTVAPTITLVGGNGGTTGVNAGTATATATIGSVTSGGLTKTGLGTLTLNAANTYTGTTTVNNGTLAVGSGGAISNAVVLGKNGVSTGILDVTAKSSFGLADLSGNGTVNIGTGKTVTATGAVAPGFGVGTLNVTGGFTLQGTATLQIAGSNGVAGTDFDLVSVTEAVTFGGSLSIASLGGYDLSTPNKTYQLFGAGSFAGDFASVSVGGTPLTFDSNTDSWSAGIYKFDETSGSLMVVPEPGTGLYLLTGATALLGMRRRRSRA